MNDVDLELIYTELAQCIARVGEEKTPLLLATLALDLLRQQPDAGAALAHIAAAEQLATVRRR
jgi:hypothetical protein